MKIPRILLAATSSGSGKTTITCGLLQALINRKLKAASFKCGPDYIDPMFHSNIIGAKSTNLDTFFTSEMVTRHLLCENFQGNDIAVMEGVMGYYDGIAGITTKASAYDLAKVTDTPVILIVNCKGISLSLAAVIKGFLLYKEDSHIQGVILNQISPMLFPRMKEQLERELDIPVLGYVPKLENCILESRHLGLVLPDEIPELKNQLNELSQILEKTLDLDAILKLADKAPDLYEDNMEDSIFHWKLSKKVRIGLAKDEAFCFFYKDNLKLLSEMGAELIPFSPIHDYTLPDSLDGILLYGGYPELHAQALEENVTMRNNVASALKSGMPCMAECGGFMYLHDEMEDMNGKKHEMTGFIKGIAYKTDSLKRFGYITLDGSMLGKIPAHEFHYFDSSNCGSDMYASKPESHRGWNCMHASGRLMAGFPHLYYYGNPKVAQSFLEQCLEYRQERLS